MSKMEKQRIIEAISATGGFLDLVSESTGIDILELEKTIGLDSELSQAYRIQQRTRIERLRRALFELLLEGKANTLYKEVLANPQLLNGDSSHELAMQFDLGKLAEDELATLQKLLQKTLPNI